MAYDSTLEPADPKHRAASIPVGSAWMVLITLVLFFLPAINGLIGGLVGGYKVGTAGRGIMAALIPAVVAGVGIWILFAVFSAPAWGILAGATATTLLIISELSLFVGAILGGLLSPKEA